MAEFLKRRAHNPLAVGDVTTFWSNFQEGARFNVAIGDYHLKLTRKEAEGLAEELRKLLSDPELETGHS